MAVSVIDATSTGSTGTVMVSGNMPTFSASASAGQTVSNNTQTKITINTKTGSSLVWDTNSNFDAVTNYRFTPTVAGYYQVSGYLAAGTGSVNTQLVEAVIYKNGSSCGIASTLVYSPTNTFSSGNSNVSGLVYCNGSSDYVELYGRIVGTGTLTFAGGSYLQACLVRGA
jgi:hypothetical protein